MKTIPIDEAVSMIPDGASLMIGGFMGCGTPEPLMDELLRQGKRELTVIANDTATARRRHWQARPREARSQGDREPHRPEPRNTAADDRR